jgi:uncharacterized DUF497 family protein
MYVRHGILYLGHWMRFEFDKQKNEYNLARHGVDFATAALIFDDPYAMTIRDVLHDEDEERYNTVGEFSPGSILFVVHTLVADEKGEEVIRLISARAATSKERKPYEEAHKRTEAASRRHRRQNRRRH